LEALFSERAPLYEASADKFFLTDQKTPDTVAQEIHKTCFEKQ
jgi:shikimate kinase